MFRRPIGESNLIRTVTEYGQYRILETTNPTNKCLMNIHNYINSLKSIFYFLNNQNITDISNKLIFV